MSCSKSIHIVVVEKSGKIVEKLVTIKNDKDLDNELYTYAGLKKKDGFEFQTEWNLWNIKELGNKTHNIFLYGKTVGKAGQENKYDFPPPLDNALYFGSCVLVNKNKSGELQSLHPEEWKQIYDYLFGGFEELGDEDDDDISNDEDYDESKLTKTGYIKDDFIVDDEEIEEEEEEEEDEEEEEERGEEEESKKNNNNKMKSKKHSKPILDKNKKVVMKKSGKEKSEKKKREKKSENLAEMEAMNHSDIYDSNELEEEEYV
jgi:hypothetical protein